MGPLLKRAHCFYPYQTTSLLGQGIRTPLSNNLNNIEQQGQLLFWASAFSFFCRRIMRIIRIGASALGFQTTFLL